MALRPIGEAFSLALTRLGAVRAIMRGIHDEIIPVAVVRDEYSDRARPLWHLQAQSIGAVGQLVSTSLTSAFDVAVYAISIGGFSLAGAPLATPVGIFTPPASYTPFAINPITWFPGVRPRVGFDVGNTVAISGRNAAPTPILGWQGQTGPETFRWVNYKSPLILPATMFLTVQILFTGQTLVTNYIYREVGRAS